MSRHLEIVCAKPVLRRGSNKLDWDNWGVRDIAILSDYDGNFIKEKSNLISYFTGSRASGSTQMVGRAFSTDNGITWQKHHENPVLSTSEDSWDSKVASTPWVIKKDNLYFMYYRGSSDACFKDAIGVATSTDGIKFKKYDANPILTSENFSSIRQNPCTMGVLNAVSDYNGNIIVLFEANESEHEKRGQIFAAISNDGFNFNSLNGGKPIFSCRDVKSWPVRAVCNPRLVKAGNGIFMLAFNGSWDGEWSIGLAFTKDFKVWEEHMSNPVLVPRGYPVGLDFTHRVEGSCFDTSAIVNGDSNIVSYIMAIPYGSLNHQNSINARVEFKLSKQRNKKQNFHAFPSNLNSIINKKDEIQLNSDLEPGGYLHGHIIKESISKINLLVDGMKFSRNDSAAFLCLSNTVNSLPRGHGLILKITKNKLCILRDDSKYSISHLLRYILCKTSIIFNKTFSGKKKCKIKNGNWLKLEKINSNDAINISIERFYVSQKVIYKVNGYEFEGGNEYSIEKRILTLAVYNASAKFSDMSIN